MEIKNIAEIFRRGHKEPLIQTESVGTNVTWRILVKEEPELKELFKEAKSIQDDGKSESFCANYIFYNRFKPRIVRLVGWTAKSRQSFMHSREAYDLAYDKIYDVLPACRNCDCF